MEEHYENVVDSTEFSKIVNDRTEPDSQIEKDALSTTDIIKLNKEESRNDENNVLAENAKDTEECDNESKQIEDETAVLATLAENSCDEALSEDPQADENELNKSVGDIEQVLVDANAEMVGEEEEIIPTGTQMDMVVPQENSEMIEDSKIEQIASEELHRNVHIIDAIQDQKIESDDEENTALIKYRNSRKMRKSSEKNGTTEGNRHRGKKVANTQNEKSPRNKRESKESYDDKCRVCLSSEELVSIFNSEDDPDIADKIMIICDNIKVVEKDFLPQYICQTCLDTLNVALKFKALFEKTDKELRSQLTRAKNKVQRPKGYVLLDATEDATDSEEGVKQNDDEEFHLSHDSQISAIESDSDSDFSISKRRPAKRRATKRRRTGGAGRGRVPGGQSSTPGETKRGRRKKANNADNSTADENATLSKNEEQTTDEGEEPTKRRRSLKKSEKMDEDGEITTPENKKKELACVYCQKVFPSMLQLREHKREHAGEKPFICHVCNKQFKLLGNFDSHMKRHMQEEVIECETCEIRFPSKREKQKHMIDVHGESPPKDFCEKCKRSFTTARRLERHQQRTCPGYEVPAARRQKLDVDAAPLGKDLFKCVAPMTTTYWSDSFSD